MSIFSYIIFLKMKKINIFYLCWIVYLIPPFLLKAQENIPLDPILKFKNFYENGIALNLSRTNPYHSAFNTPYGNLTLKSNSSTQTYDFRFNYGWLFKYKEPNEISLKILKTGINLLSRNAELSDSLDANFSLNTHYIQIPLQFGYRRPLKYNTIKNNLYRAIEYNIGFYAATPIYQSLINIDNLANSKNNFYYV